MNDVGFAKKEKTNHDRLFGVTKITFEGLPMGTLRIRENIISIKMGCPVTVYNLHLFRATTKNLRCVKVSSDIIYRGYMVNSRMNSGFNVESRST